MPPPTSRPVALVADVGLVLLVRKELPARQSAGIHRLRQGEPGQDAVRLRRHRHLVACRMRAAQPDDRHRHRPRALSRRRPRARRPDRRAHRLSLQHRLDRWTGAGDEAGQRARGTDSRALADPARSADRARAGPAGLRRLHVERGVHAERHAGGAGRQAQRRDRQGDGQCRHSASACNARPHRRRKPERRTPDYLGKFVANEIDKWAAPIKASGAKED